MIDPARTIGRYWDGILQAVTSRLAIGPLEGINSISQANKANTRSNRNKSNLIATTYQLGGGA
jgi:transposase